MESAFFDNILLGIGGLLIVWSIFWALHYDSIKGRISDKRRAGIRQDVLDQIKHSPDASTIGIERLNGLIGVEITRLFAIIEKITKVIDGNQGERIQAINKRIQELVDANLSNKYYISDVLLPLIFRGTWKRKGKSNEEKVDVRHEINHLVDSLVSIYWFICTKDDIRPSLFATLGALDSRRRKVLANNPFYSVSKKMALHFLLLQEIGIVELVEIDCGYRMKIITATSFWIFCAQAKLREEDLIDKIITIDGERYKPGSIKALIYKCNNCVNENKEIKEAYNNMKKITEKIENLEE